MSWPKRKRLFNIMGRHVTLARAQMMDALVSCCFLDPRSLDSSESTFRGFNCSEPVTSLDCFMKYRKVHILKLVTWWYHHWKPSLVKMTTLSSWCGTGGCRYDNILLSGHWKNLCQLPGFGYYMLNVPSPKFEVCAISACLIELQANFDYCVQHISFDMFCSYTHLSY